MWKSSFLLFTLAASLSYANTLHGQDNYEIQVYGADTVPANDTMVELHSNFTVSGSQAAPGSTRTIDNLEPTNHAEHETVEITHGWTPWFETGFYIFTSINGNDGWQWVGDHIRPRVRVPDSWHWPVGVSLSTEVGYQRPLFSPDTWTWEIRPIVDKKIGGWYLSFNPSLERSWHGASVSKGVEFSPNFKVSYDFLKFKSSGYTKVVSGGLEYYGALGPVTGFDPAADQEQQFVPSIDIDVSPVWEINFGVGIGTTRSTDHLIVKGIIGRRFSFGHQTKQ
jgi:hypothetical protein